MKFPLSTYQKLFDSFILELFPDIEYLKVEYLSFPFDVDSGIKVDFYLVPEEKISTSLSCHQLLELLRIEVGKLVKYLGDKIKVDMTIYFKGEPLCDNLFGF